MNRKMRRRWKVNKIPIFLFFVSFSVVWSYISPSFIAYALDTSFEVTAVNIDGDVEEKVTFSGGDISKDTVPVREGYQFIKAYVLDSETQNQVEIENAHVKEGRVYFRLKGEQQESLEHSYVLPDASDKIFFMYRNVVKTIQVTYAPNKDQDIIVTGPDTLDVSNGTATGNFTVSVPRQNDIVLDTNNSNVKKDADISTTERTVYRYRIQSTSDITIPISSVDKQNLTLTAQKTISDDWDMKGYKPNTNYFYNNAMIVTQNVTDNDIQAGRNLDQSSYSFQYGNTVHLKVYHDKTLDIKNGTFSSFLSVIYLNGQPFGVPQPFSRFGISKYPSEIGKDPYNRPYYEGAQKNGTGIWSYMVGGAGFENRDKLVSTFSRPQGFDPYLHASWSDNNERGFRVWYADVIYAHVIGQKNTIHVENGPLAGATITITIMDAKPDNYTGKLMSWDYDEQGNIATPFTLDYTKFNNEDGWGKGSHNSLRLAYDIQIDNAPTDIVAQTEWATTASSKVGMYLNYGVEDVEVYASNLNAVSTSESVPSWQSAQTAWFNTVGLGGASRHNSYSDIYNGKAQETKDPQLAIRGNVKNGYTSPTYRDDTVAPIHATAADPNVFANPSVNEQEAPGKGFYGKYPVFTQLSLGIDTNSSDQFVRVAGMNVVGVQAKLMHLPVDYQLDGGTVQDTSLFPTKDISLTQQKYLYDVEGNPVIHIPTEVPTKENAQFSHWEIFKLNGDHEEDTYVKALPGNDIDITDTDLFGRISYTDGTINFDGIRLKAVYIDDKDNSGNNFVVNHFYKENADSQDNEAIEQVGSFISVFGSDSNLSKTGETELAKETIEYNGNTYRRIDIEKGEETSHPIGGFVTFAPNQNSIDIVYVRVKKGTVKVRYEDEDGQLLPNTTEELLKDNVLVGTQYEAVKKEFDEYEFKEMKEGSAPEKGSVQEGEQTVVYVYALKRYEVPETGLDFPYGIPLLIVLDALLPLAMLTLLRHKKR